MRRITPRTWNGPKKNYAAFHYRRKKAQEVPKMVTKKLAQQFTASEPMRRITPGTKNSPKKNHDALQMS